MTIFSQDEVCHHQKRLERPYIDLKEATGGLLENRHPFICGGKKASSGSGPTERACYYILSPDVCRNMPPSAQMLNPRAYATSIVVGEKLDTLFIVGGYMGISG